MAEPISQDTLDFDQPINTDPDYSVTHIFSTDDITATFDGDTQGDAGANFVDFTATPKVTKEGISLYPIDSEFGFVVTDFSGAEEKTIDGLYTEGWAGDLTIAGAQAGLVISDAPTDTFKTPAGLGTWLTGLGSNTVKASTEHYSVMQNVLSDQRFPDDPDAAYALDNDLILLSQNPDWDGQKVSDLLAGNVAGVTITDVNLDGVTDIRDLLNPNESTIDFDIAYGNDYSVTMKDDGKLLYRWGNSIKRPNDVRVEAELELPEEFSFNDTGSGLKQLFRITEAELVTHHTITNNPNDQIRPEDFENESAIGTLPTYVEYLNYNGETDRTRWETTDDYYAGDGTLYAAGTVLRDTALVADMAPSILNQIGATSEDLELGLTNAWYTTMDREPFEPELTDTGEYETGPRWRLLPDKYGQDLPSVVIPIDPSEPLPITSGEQKYEVGAETQTVINLLDWESPTSPLEISAGWQNNPDTVSANGVNMSENFDVAFYVKGDIKPATIYSTELVMSYEAIDLHDAGTVVSGTADSDFLVGINGNTFNGGTGEDLFVLSYGVSATGPEIVTASIIEDFEIGADKLGLIGFDALAGFDIDLVADRSLIQQGVSLSNSDDLTISVDGVLVATLEGVATALNVSAGVTAGVDAGEGLDILESFLITNPGEGMAPPVSTAVWSMTGDASVEEGGSADYTLSLTGLLLNGETAAIDIGITNVGTTTSDDYADFVAAVNTAVVSRADLGFDGTTLTYTGDGNPMTDLVISLGIEDDALPEDAEDYTVALSNPTGDVVVTLDPASDDVTTTIGISDQGPPAGAIIGTEFANFLIGTPDGDLLFGLGGNDSIYGLDGDDLLDGGEGKDLLYGGGGADEYVLSSSTDVDTIIGFEDGLDKIRLEGISFDDVTIESQGLYVTVSVDDDSLRILNLTGISITIDDFSIA